MSVNTEMAQAEVPKHRAAAAARVAAEVRRADGQRMVSKITTLMHAFRAKGSGARGARQVTAELDRLGVLLTPDLATADRTGCVELSLRSPEDGGGPAQGAGGMIQVSSWRAGTVEDERPLDVGQAAAVDGEVLWFNVEPLTGQAPTPTSNGGKAVAGRTQWRKGSRSDHSVHAAGPGHTETSVPVLDQRVTDVFAQLGRLCRGLEEEMIKDLLSEDIQPKVEPYGDESDRIRGVSAVAVIAREIPSDPEDWDGMSERLIFQLVETIVGEGWIITCWHPSRVFIGPAHNEPGDPVLREPFLSHVRHRWSQNPGRAQTSGDLGLYLTRSLVETYGASHRMLERWVEHWELHFYGDLSDAKMETIQNATVEISNVLSLVGEFRRRLTAFDHARWSTSDKTWFPRLSDRAERMEEDPNQNTHVEKLAGAVQATTKKLDLLFDTIRADMDLLMLRSVGTQQDSSERLQRQLAKVTALLLVPTLIAGIFGANTQIPGGGRWAGFELMLVLMVFSAIAVYLTMKSDFHEPRRPSRRAR